jgi:UPF0755 protein
MLDQLGLDWEQEETRRPHRPSSQQRRRKKRKKRRSAGSMLLSTVLLIALGVGTYWGVGQIQNNQRLKEMFASDYSQGDMGDPVDFTVRQGDGGTLIAVRLLAAGVIESRTAFVQVCDSRATECKAIQPGRYSVRLHSPAAVVFDILKNPANRKIDKFTIREGLTVIETLNELAKQTGIPLADFQAAASDPAALGITPDWYTVPGKPSAAADRKSLEGFLFPDTYQYDASFTAKAILQVMVDQFKKVAGEVDLKGRAQALNVAPYELLIVASIAQAEVHEADFPTVARVIFNRVYKAKMVLGMDSTENYWLELNGKPMKPSGQLLASELNDPNNPYNTHGKKGLPIGPISNPGKAAMSAAGNPATGNWLYFVAVDSSGTTKFAVTFSEFCSLKRQAVQNGVAISLADC